MNKETCLAQGMKQVQEIDKLEVMRTGEAFFIDSENKITVYSPVKKQEYFYDVKDYELD